MSVSLVSQKISVSLDARASVPNADRSCSVACVGGAPIATLDGGPYPQNVFLAGFGQQYGTQVANFSHGEKLKLVVMGAVVAISMMAITSS